MTPRPKVRLTAPVWKPLKSDLCEICPEALAGDKMMLQKPAFPAGFFVWVSWYGGGLTLCRGDEFPQSAAEPARAANSLRLL